MIRINIDSPAVAEVKQAIRKRQIEKQMWHQPEGGREPITGHDAHKFVADCLNLKKPKITRK